MIELLNDPEFTRPLVLVRERAGTRDDNGEWVPGEREEIPTRGSVQPLDLADERLQRLPQDGGDRVVAAKEIFLPASVDAQPLRTGEGQTAGDILRVDGLDYRVASCAPYDEHSEIIAVRLEGDA